MVFQTLRRLRPGRMPIPRPSKIFTRKLMLPFTAVSVLAAKLLHIYAHRQALATEDIVFWGASFFFQDVLFVLLVRILLESRLTLFSVLGSSLSVTVLVLSCGTLACYMTIYTEPDWNNAGIVLDPAWWAVLPTGLASLAFVSVMLILVAATTQHFWIVVADMIVDILAWPVRRLWGSKKTSSDHTPVNKYETDFLHPEDGQGLLGYTDDDAAEQGLHLETQLPAPSKSAIGGYAICATVFFATALTSALRPNDSAFTLLSWTLPLQPIVDLSGHGGQVIITSHTSGPNTITEILHGKTALTTPVPLTWLPKGDALLGFEDWYNNREHYNAEADPIKVSNIHDNLVPQLRGMLSDVDIRHLVIVEMESIRKDVFPIKKDGKIWKKLLGKTTNNTLAKDVYNRLATLTPLANALTCDFDDGFRHKNRTCRGGISTNNAFTTSTYTLKSVIATLCGIGPIASDFNVEAKHHFYQPCLTHVLDALNALEVTAERTYISKEFQPYPWKSFFFQSATDSFDNQSGLFPILGYNLKNVITKEYLQSASARFGKSTLSDVNYFSIPEVALEDYIKDAFVTAKEKNERVFLTHLTSTTHHAFGIPSGEHYVKMSENVDLQHLSRYINAVGYSDRWLTRFLSILEEQGVANETLVVLAGDHGMPVAEDGVATYHNDETASFHVPIVFSHPKLPKISIESAVSTVQILPTILDLLMESNSLSNQSQRAAADLVRNYEGQSLLRPIHPAAKNGHGDWQFSVTNPGGATLAVRDGRNPDWRLTYPITSGQDWHFVDSKSNTTGIFSLSFDTLRNRVNSQLGQKVAEWVEEAAIVTRWWLNENQKRWRFGKYAP